MQKLGGFSKSPPFLLFSFALSSALLPHLLRSFLGFIPSSPVPRLRRPHFAHARAHSRVHSRTPTPPPISVFAFTLHRSIPTHCLSTHKGWTFLHTPSPSPSLHLPSRDSPQPATEKSHFFRHFPRISSPLSLPRQLQNQPPSK